MSATTLERPAAQQSPPSRVPSAQVAFHEHAFHVSTWVGMKRESIIGCKMVVRRIRVGEWECISLTCQHVGKMDGEEGKGKQQGTKEI